MRESCDGGPRPHDPRASLYAELAPIDVLHAVSRDGVTETDFGAREFATLDPDGNLIEFFRWR